MEEWKKSFGVNVFGTVAMTKYVSESIIHACMLLKKTYIECDPVRIMDLTEGRNEAAEEW